MKLDKIVLHNIRSYTDAQIDFPEGNLLLSGEAGSGKSSILLGIEFALFGLGKGKEGVSSDALLRRGKDEGFVELSFTLESQKIEIKRALKRKGEKAAQTGGHIIVNGQQEILSADELKTKVLQLFNYPLEFIKKGKGLPFHYTVYTQQEQMKSILLEGADLRLNTLRRVFGVDRYKIIKENADIFLGALRDKIRINEGIISDLPEKMEQLQKQANQKVEQETFLRTLLPELDLTKNELQQKKNEVNELEDRQREINQKKESLSGKRAEINANKERVVREEREIGLLQESLSKVEQEGKVFSLEELEKVVKEITFCREQVQQKEQEARNYLQALSKVEAKKEASLSLKNKISELDTCPECGQKVTPEHINEITTRATKEILDADLKFNEISGLKQQKEQEKVELETKRTEFETRERELRELKARADSLIEKKERKQRIEKEKLALLEKIGLLEQEINVLEEFLQSQQITEDYSKKKQEFEQLQQKERDLEIEKAGMQKLIESFVEQEKLLTTEISRKEKIKQNMHSLKELKDWISSGFSSILQKIEQSVLATLHSQFDSLLKNWFSMLVEEPEISVRLDSAFSPVVEQAGYDTDYSHLSGGERTAVALAYRLALNQVVNSLISQIKTRDLLILDEPTDGFSHSQLDRMRNVFQGLNLKQLIIISHNPKIEGFVDHIIRIEKEGHVSKVVK